MSEQNKQTLTKISSPHDREREDQRFFAPSAVQFLPTTPQLESSEVQLRISKPTVWWQSHWCKVSRWCCLVQSALWWCSSSLFRFYCRVQQLILLTCCVCLHWWHWWLPLKRIPLSSTARERRECCTTAALSRENTIDSSCTTALQSVAHVNVESARYIKSINRISANSCHLPFLWLNRWDFDPSSWQDRVFADCCAVQSCARHKTRNCWRCFCMILAERMPDCVQNLHSLVHVLLDLTDSAPHPLTTTARKDIR